MYTVFCDGVIDFLRVVCLCCVTLLCISGVANLPPQSPHITPVKVLSAEQTTAVPAVPAPLPQNTLKKTTKSTAVPSAEGMISTPHGFVASKAAPSSTAGPMGNPIAKGTVPIVNREVCIVCMCMLYACVCVACL